MSGQMQGKADIASVLSVGYEEQAESPSCSNTNMTNRAESSYETTEQLLVKADGKEVIIISSDDEGEELNYSEMELSDSDPMEECYRIFMEANNENKGNEDHLDLPIGAMDVVKPEVITLPPTLRGKKRVAHEAKPTELVAKSRPQPQVLVPLRGPAASGFRSWPSVTSKIQQVQQRASMLSASVKGSHAFVSSSFQNKPETQSAPSALTQTPENLQPAPMQNVCLNYIPVGNNFHFILPEGTIPLPIASSSSPVTTVLTPISQMHQSAFTVKQMYHPPVVTPVQRYRSTAPVLIPPLARKPSLTSAFASPSLHSSLASSTVPQASVQAPVSTKRKLKQQCDAAKEKVPNDVRQRYISLFTEEFYKTTGNADFALEKALAEEKTVYNRSVNKFKYMSIAVNALKKLKNQSTVAAKDENEVNSQRLKGNVPLNLNKFKANDDMALYESLKDYILTDEKLTEGNYPVQHPERHGCAVLFTENKRVHADSLKRICCRCGATYSVSQTGKHIRKEECIYHYGKAVTNRVPGGVETRYSCCEGVMGTPGCQMFKLHVHDSLSLDGFVSTFSRCPSDTSCPGIYSLDCEKCYTIHGLELSRVTVVNSSLQVVYDTFVRPDNEVIDYNTRFSGISEEDVKSNHTSLREVQETLLSFINANTILIGHSLETDLCLLKLLHGTVVDTSVVFPHRLGPPHKLTLNRLTAEYLRRIIQESVCGHDTAEDAAACMELMLWKVKEDGKMKK
ncbi:putative exonuclease GOR [Acanthochromis polyacanthus]|uniref:putative exonuclease GOR n=1 Tax=Acanthochromis polyacanthus TaxID=80966 RepID=UPI00223477BF|nr:putative exonuclease GOR [Acanthochromis polyacanthus]